MPLLASKHPEHEVNEVLRVVAKNPGIKAIEVLRLCELVHDQPSVNRILKYLADSGRLDRKQSHPNAAFVYYTVPSDNGELAEGVHAKTEPAAPAKSIADRIPTLGKPAASPKSDKLPVSAKPASSPKSDKLPVSAKPASSPKSDKLPVSTKPEKTKVDSHSRLLEDFSKLKEESMRLQQQYNETANKLTEALRRLGHYEQNHEYIIERDGAEVVNCGSLENARELAVEEASKHPGAVVRLMVLIGECQSSVVWLRN